MKIWFAIALATCVFIVPIASSQCIQVTAGTVYTQDFNSLAQSGTSSAMPAGWFFSESGTNANATYTAGTGSSNAGDTYSFGNTSNPTNRSLGGLQSGSLIPTFGACFTNNTGVTISSLGVAYIGRQWRLGTSGRGADRIDFQFSTNATSLTSGTWTDKDSLDFSSIITSGTVGAIDGGAVGNFVAIGDSIAGLSIPQGASFWIRWSDFNASGADDGLAVDDFSLSTGTTAATTLSINDVTAAEGNSGTTTFHFTVSLNAASASAVTFDIATADGTATSSSDYVAKSLAGQTIPAGSTTYGFDVTVNGDTTFESDETFSVNVTNVVGATVAKGQGLGTISNDDVSGPAPGTIVISQVYGGGGNSGATLKNDFVELYNRSNADVMLNGWSVQYTGGTASFPNGLTLLSGTIHAHSYFLVQEAQGAGGTVDLPTADVTGSIPMGATAGKVALVQTSAALSGSCPTGPTIMDFVGYGNATCSEGTAIGLLSNTSAAFRLLGGCKENNANSTDFFVAPPAPRNSATAGPDCSIAVETFPPHVVISQLYPGGGNSGASLSNDFIELYNPTSGAVNLNGWSLQYTSATGNTWGVNTLPIGGTVQPGEYFLIELASGGSNGTPLPSPRIIGDINMAATIGGKVLLARTTSGLTGNCPIGDPTLVDLVGYGAADCYTGGLNAPIPPNTTFAILRNNNGNANTNQNSVDFSVGTPNPLRGSGPIIDLPPFITSVDPAGADAPFDASMTINFSKGVDVSGSWYSITCSQSGLHDNVIVNSAFAQTAYILTPNITFIPGETCNVHIAGNLIHESGGLAQSLLSDTDFSFTVATGAPSVDAVDVNLVMGNPTNASAADANNYLMTKPQFSESYNRDSGRPNWVSWHLTDAWSPAANSSGRTNTFRPDPALPSTWYRVLHTDFSGSGFDRGHMSPSADRTANVPINEATFLMSNMVAQAPDNNQGPWETLESYIRTLLPANDVYIVSGPAGRGGIGSNGPASTVANGHVVVPAFTWKAALVVPKGLTNPAAVTASMRTIAVIMPNIQGIKPDDWQKRDANGNYLYVTTVHAVEALCACDLFSNVPEAVQNAIEAGTNGVNPPGAANGSLSTAEDNAATANLIAVSPTGSTLNYTITGGPSHGALSGSGGSRTYTPAPDFNGSDSFSFTASDSSGTSNTATVTITVTEVNDAPVAAVDAKATNEDSALTFPAADLTANDSAGPANESSQTLTMTSVSPGAATHGTVSLNAGTITYSPDADYNGPASFTYQVCDNGTTAGAPDAKCATATVNVTVNEVNDPPTAADDTASVEAGGTLTIAGNVLTANDSAGPANESSQTLTVISVSNAVKGSASLSSGQVTFTPAVPYTGPASFTYQVCDNGTTAGVADPKCATATVNVTVEDTVAPSMSNLTLSAAQLWPPNHQMVDINVAYTATDLGDPAPACTLGITSNELVNGTGDGDMAPDWEVVDAHHVRLRAERAGTGTGRIYTIAATCSDASGNASTKSATVSVPKNQGK